jgi:hypothetical protein
MAILAPVMKLFRTSIARGTFILLTGIAFLNLGFVLLEVNLLDINKDLPVFSSLNAYGAEEEEHGEEAPSSESGKEVDLHVDELITHHQVVVGNTQQTEAHLYNLKVISASQPPPCPPPELS